MKESCVSFTEVNAGNEVAEVWLGATPRVQIYRSTHPLPLSHTCFSGKTQSS